MGNCYKCELLAALYEQVLKTPRNYYAMTELFVLLHDGSDVCEAERRNMTTLGRPDIDALYGIWVKSKTYEGWLKDNTGRVIYTSDYRIALATAASQRDWETHEARCIDDWILMET